VEHRLNLDSPSIDPVLKAGAHAATSDTVHFYTGRRFSPMILGSEPDQHPSSENKDLYEVRIIDNDHNTYEEVIRISMAALGISEAQAFVVAWEVDHYGSCVVARGPHEEAEAVASVIRTIGIEVQVNLVGATEC
jgi:ATP-dependent Clp protease adapter protein ClpS